MALQLLPFPSIRCQNHQQWLDECQRLWDTVRMLREHGGILECVVGRLYEGRSQRGKRLVFDGYQKSRIAATLPGGYRQAGACVLLRDKDHDLYLGGSFCHHRDRGRYSRIEGLARAVRNGQKILTVDALKLSVTDPRLAHLPPSCRTLGKQMLMNYQVQKNASVIGSRIASPPVSS